MTGAASDLAGRPDVSVVIPCYYSEATIGKVVALTRDVLRERGDAYEFVLVNDGSTDGTFARIRELAEADPCVHGVCLSRNFGQHNAIMAGLARVRGHVVMLMDDDMQTHPSQCSRLLDEMETGAWDVVFARYPAQREAAWRRLGSRFAVATERALMGCPKGIDTTSFFVMRDFVAHEVTRYAGPYVSVQGLIFRVTRTVCNVDVEHFEREQGTSGYTFGSLVRLWSSVLTFSVVPLRAASVVGSLLGLAGVVGAIALVVRRVLDPTVQQGWSSLMVTVLICSGLTIAFLGLAGEYLGRLFMTANREPQYVVRETVGLPRDAEGADARARGERTRGELL